MRAVYFIALTVVAFGLRFGWAAWEDPAFQGPMGEISNDDVQFHRLAENLASGEGYRVSSDRPLTSFRAPGFPFALALLYCIVGVEPISAYIVFALLGVLGCYFSYLLASELLNETGARVAGFLAAIYLPYAFMATRFISENVYVPLLALGLWLFIRAWRKESHWILASAGIVLGYATLTRPAALLLLPLLLTLLAWFDWQARRFQPARYFVLAIPFLAVIAPWTMRNHDVHGKWILVATNGGTTFWGGNNDRVLNETRHLGYWVPSTDLPDRNRIDDASNEVERDAVEWALGKAWVAEHWTEMPLLLVFKSARLWWLPDYGGGPRWVRIASYAPFLILFGLFAVRCAWRREYRTPSWLVIHCSMLALFAAALIFCGEPRYRDANMPVLMIFAVAGLFPSSLLSRPSPLAPV